MLQTLNTTLRRRKNSCHLEATRAGTGLNILQDSSWSWLSDGRSVLIKTQSYLINCGPLYVVGGWKRETCPGSFYVKSCPGSFTHWPSQKEFNAFKVDGRQKERKNTQVLFLPPPINRFWHTWKKKKKGLYFFKSSHHHSVKQLVSGRWAGHQLLGHKLCHCACATHLS